MAQLEITSTQNDVTGYAMFSLLADGARAVADNNFTDAELNSPEWQEHQDSYPRWVTPIVVNEAPGIPIGETVEYQNATFKVPEQFRGMTDVILVLSITSATELDGKLVLVGDVSKVLDYPRAKGWYSTDEDTGIPIAIPKRSAAEGARYLLRSSGAYVGPIARDFDIVGYYDKRYVDISANLDDEFKVAFVEGVPQSHADEDVPAGSLLRNNK